MDATREHCNRFLNYFRRLAIFGATLLLAGCTNLVFQPMRQHVFDPATAGISYEDRTFTADDGTTLHGWWLPVPAVHAVGSAPATRSRGTVIFLYGNAENISTHIASVHWLPASGYNVYLYDYRGFGKSGGVANYESARRDLWRAIDFVSSIPEVKDGPLFVFGQSLGGAISLSSLGGSHYRLRIDGLVIEGAPSSLRDAARDALASHWLTWAFQIPLSWLISDADSPRDQIAGIAPTPVMIIHSRDDRVVRFRHGELLQANAPVSSVWRATTGRHIAAMENPEDRQALLDFLEQSRRRSEPR